MNIENFFNNLNEKSWRQNMRFHAERKFEALIDYLNESKEDILDDIVSDVKEMESIKNEDKEIFDYAMFENWLNKLSKTNMSAWIEDDDPEAL